MAFTITVSPNTVGDRKSNIITATFDAATGSHEIACTLNQLGLSRLDTFQAEISNQVASTTLQLYLVYDRAATKLKVYGLSSAGQVGSSETLSAGVQLSALAVGV